MSDGADPIAGRLTEYGHELTARVYYADTDFSGAVYHARYLEFLERGRSDFLRLAGVHHAELEAGQAGETLYWVVRHMDIEFRASGRIDDLLSIQTRVASLSGARIRMLQRIGRGDTDLIVAKVEAALINANGRPRRFPKEWAELFAPRS
ncbi:YbgC/FadM family acyl-CoA thioesterase [Oricola cellulosilytica]|uniref:YbgC/FadM family acyl-CoA thioesterase n=1 Tax=Oricola cellulosilytica TaxID=1429082 RepID=A0A4R0PD78_9HYPH|nr:YbgC/FadM family acyl-CoA thioesterase [Oricola cellulosilytica]TCD15440.1 YbgC/FadM family acyl-CoA thioesterase [Oricola cellulosilytica]